MCSVCVDVGGRKLGSLLFVCFYREPPERSRDYSPKQRGWIFGVCVVVLYCMSIMLPVCVCGCSSFLSTYSSNIIGVAWRVPEP